MHLFQQVYVHIKISSLLSLHSIILYSHTHRHKQTDTHTHTDTYLWPKTNYSLSKARQVFILWHISTSICTQQFFFPFALSYCIHTHIDGQTLTHTNTHLWPKTFYSPSKARQVFILWHISTSICTHQNLMFLVASS